MRGEGIILAPESVEAVACRVAELLGAASTADAPGRLLTAAETAARLGCSREWVYSNSDRLGAIRLPSRSTRSTKPRPRLRFRADLVDRALLANLDRPEPTSAAAKRRPVKRFVDIELLPIGGTTRAPP